MEASAELVGVILIALIAISLATIVHGVVISTLPEPENPDFTPPPELLDAKMRVMPGEESYTELNLHLSTCKGIRDAYVTLLGISGTEGNEEIAGFAEILSCQNDYATVKLPPVSGYDKYKAYIWKYGIKSSVVDVEVEETGGEEGEG